MLTPDEMFAKLAEPFPADAISWRVGSTNGDKTKGLALAYLDARDVMDRLDAVCGPGSWQDRYPHALNKTVCEIDIWVEGRGWVTKADGAGDSDIEAEKGALSDAFKRAAVRWGVGRYLYGLKSPWVELEAAGRSQRIKESEYRKLRACLDNYARASAPPSQPAQPTAADLAIQLLRAATSPADFRQVWETNKPQWKEVMGSDDYARVVAAMQEEAARYAPKAA